MAAWKEALKKIPGVHALGKGIKNRIHDMKVIPALLAERRIRREGPIRVGFLCQYIPAWTKVASVYEQMKADPRFEPVLLCLPSGIEKNRLINPDSLENDTYDYFISKGYSEAVNTLIGKETWLDLKELNLAYIFYPRPYNALIPASYSSRIVSRYSRICILMYGPATTEEITRTVLNRPFMGSVYFYFAETPFSRQINIRNNRFPHWLGLQHSECHGLPVLEQLAKAKGQPSDSWNFSKNEFRAIWAPRWTTDKEDGGSNFFTYYKSLPAYAAEHPDMDFLFRPHPLTFQNFIKTGEMTPQEVEEFKAVCQSLPNLRLDQQPQYEATFWNSSVLISDISAIMPEYFTTGKPLIFCASNMELNLADYMKKMIKGCYVVYNEQELFACLDRLRAGDDPLYEDRQALITEVFGTSSENASKRIMEAIADDFNK